MSEWGWTRGRLVMPALGLWTLAVYGGDLAAQSARERFPLGTGSIAIYNLAGELTVEPGSGPDVVVEVIRVAPMPRSSASRPAPGKACRPSA